MRSQVLALAQATRAEITRQPGVMLATCGIAALLFVLHDMSAATFDATGALARELTWSTASLYAAVLGGIYGARCTAAGSDLAPSMEIFATDTTREAYVLGRLLGVAQGVALQVSILTVVAIFADLLHGGGADVGRYALGACGALLQGCLFAALGALLGAFTPATLSIALVLLAVIAARWVGPGGGEAASGVLARCVPDPLRLDLAREIGFAKPISTAAVGLSWIATGLQIAAILIVTSLSLRRERT